MISKTIKFQVRTPLFLGTTIRNDPDKEKEVRIKKQQKRLKFKVRTTNAQLNANAFKGILRWWFRTVTGYANNLAKQEEKIFGSTKTAAKFKIKIIANTLNTIEWKNTLKAKNFGNYDVVDWRGNNRKSFYNGLNYFSQNLYTESKRESNPSISKKEYFEPCSSNFELKLFAETEEILNKLMMLFWLSFQFGGIGSRSRRAFGNLKILAEPKDNIIINRDTFVFKNSYIDTDDYEKTIKDNLKIINQQFILNNNGNLSTLIPCLNNARVYYSKENTKDFNNNSQNRRKGGKTKNADWIEAINVAGLTMQFFRAMRDNDHKNVHTFNSLSQIERAVFGLPLQFRFSKGGAPVTINQYDTEGNAQRLASPIWASVTEIDNAYHVQYLILPFDYNSKQLMRIKADQKNTTGKRSITIFENTVTDFEKFLTSNTKSEIYGAPVFDQTQFEYKKLI